MNKTIFIIDDDPLLRLLVERMMTVVDKSLTFIPCENGKTGLDRLNEYLGSSTSCIVLLDLNMPVLDGWAVLNKIQATPMSSRQNMTIYILSSSTDISDLEKAREYECVKKFYHKPLNRDDIVQILNGG